MGKYVKTLYRITLKADFGRDKETLIFEMRSIKTASAFEKILKRARLPIDILSLDDARPRNKQGWRHYTTRNR